MKQINVRNVLAERNDLLVQYEREISKYKSLSAEEEFSLFERLKSGDYSVKEKIINSNLKFVVSCAKKYTVTSVPLMDLINEGNIGLIKAVDKFDHTKGFKFISYAVTWIMQSIYLAISNDARLIRIPTQITGIVVKVKNEADKIENFIDYSELSQKLNIPEYVIKTILEDSYCKPLDKPINTDDDFSLLDVIEDQDNGHIDYNSDHIKFLIKSGLDALPSYESDLVKRAYGLSPYWAPQSSDDIAKEIGVTGQTVLNNLKKSIVRIRKRIKSKRNETIEF